MLIVVLESGDIVVTVLFDNGVNAGVDEFDERVGLSSRVGSEGGGGAMVSRYEVRFLGHDSGKSITV